MSRGKYGGRPIPQGDNVGPPLRNTISSMFYISPAAELNLSRIFHHEGLVIAPISNIHFRNGFTFKGIEMGADSIEEPAVVVDAFLSFSPSLADKDHTCGNNNDMDHNEDGINGDSISARDPNRVCHNAAKDLSPDDDPSHDYVFHWVT